MNLPSKNKLLLTVLALGTVILLSAFSTNDDLIDRLLAGLKQYNEQNPQEKVFVHLDREAYVGGETMWYKAYLVDAASHKPVDWSKLIHVTLHDPEGNRVFKQHLKVEKGFAKGDFDLPRDLSTGTYTLSAYTRHMQNYDPRFYFSEQLHIYHPTDTSQNDIPAPKLASVDFFPEGGDLVAGVICQVAFKAVDQQGRGIGVGGIVLDDLGNQVAEFQSFHGGMGAFEFIPEIGAQYIARILNDGKTIASYKLPIVQTEGVVLRVDNTDSEKITTLVLANERFAAKAGAPLLLIAQAKGNVYFAANGSIKGKPFIANFPKADLPAGIVQLTLFNAEGQPLAERLVFVQKPETLAVKITPNQRNFSPRDQVTLDIQVNDPDGKGVPAELSLAVNAHNRIGSSPYQNHLVSHLLLSSDLVGTVENPGFYFDPQQPKATEALDHLMLTQGWRRFLWKDLLGGEAPDPKYNFEQSLTLEGRATKTLDGTPAAFTPLEIFLGEYHYTYQAMTDAEGNFRVTIFDYPQSATCFFISPNADEKLTITLNHPPALLSKNHTILSSTTKNYQEQRGQVRQMIRTFGKMAGAAKVRPLVKGFYREADNVIKIDEYYRLPNMAEVIRELVPAADVRGRVGKQRLQMISLEKKALFDGRPLIIIDGVPTYDHTRLLNLNPDEVERLELIHSEKRIRRLGRLGIHGVFAAYTYLGRYEFDTSTEGILRQVPGVYEAREFFTPAYETEASLKERTPDFRSLVFWAPKVQTDENGRATVTFYHSDDIGSFEVEAQGLSFSGLPGGSRSTYQVK